MKSDKMNTGPITVTLRNIAQKTLDEDIGEEGKQPLCVYSSDTGADTGLVKC